MKNFESMIYRGVRIKKSLHRWHVYGWAWGDEIGEDFHRFKTLTAAKAFVDRMLAEKPS